MKLALERIEDQTEAFQSCRTQERFVPLLPEDHRRCAPLATILKVRITDLAAHDRTIREREVELLVGFDPKRPKLLGRNEAVNCSRINQEINRALLSARARRLD